jgi:hypothetical protein
MKSNHKTDKCLSNLILSCDPSGASSSAAADAAFVTAYDSYCAERLDPFVAVCDKLGGGAAKGVCFADYNLFVSCGSLLRSAVFCSSTVPLTRNALTLAFV